MLLKILCTCAFKCLSGILGGKLSLKEQQVQVKSPNYYGHGQIFNNSFVTQSVELSYCYTFQIHKYVSGPQGSMWCKFHHQRWHEALLNVEWWMSAQALHCKGTNCPYTPPSCLENSIIQITMHQAISNGTETFPDIVTHSPLTPVTRYWGMLFEYKWKIRYGGDVNGLNCCFRN